MRTTSGKHSLFKGSFGFLQSSFSSFCDNFYPFNVDGAVCVRVFDPLEVLYPDLVVLLATPDTELLAYNIVYSVVEALRCVAS